MDGSLVALALLVLGLVAFDLAALRFGSDSRSGKREMPTAADLPLPVPHVKGHRRRWRRGQETKPLVVTQLLVLSETGPGGARISQHVVTPVGRGRRSDRPFKLPVSVGAQLYSQFDLAARGK